MTLKLGLASYLIKTPSACYLQTVVYGERHFLAEVQGICRIVTSDRDRLAIDETIDRKWCAQILDFTKNLLHFTISKGLSIQTVYPFIVIKQNFCPIFDELSLRWIVQHLACPSIIF